MLNKLMVENLLKDVQKKFPDGHFELELEINNTEYVIYTDNEALYDSKEFGDYLEGLDVEYDDVLFLCAPYSLEHRKTGNS